MEILQAIRRVIFKHNWDALEWFSAASVSAYGFWLLLPFDTFAGAPAYSTIGAILTEFQWGMILFSVGTILLIGVYQNNRKIRRVFVMGCFLLWLFFEISFVQQRPSAGIIPIIALILVALAVNYIRLAPSKISLQDIDDKMLR